MFAKMDRQGFSTGAGMRIPLQEEFFCDACEELVFYDCPPGEDAFHTHGLWRF